MSAAQPASQFKRTSLTLMPIMAAVFAGFLIIGVALPVLPLHVSDDLGYGPFVVGLVGRGAVRSFPDLAHLGGIVRRS
jgi:hypothetical protein